MTLRDLDADIRFYKREMDNEVEKYGITDTGRFDPYVMSKERVDKWEKWYLYRKYLVRLRWESMPERSKVYAWLKSNEKKHLEHLKCVQSREEN